MGKTGSDEHEDALAVKLYIYRKPSPIRINFLGGREDLD
jgi:hypothetical protein